MATMGCYTIVPEFFTKRRSLALAVLNTGAGLGSAVTPSLITFLIEEYGTSGALLLSGGIMLQTLPLAILCHKEAGSSTERTHKPSEFSNVASKDTTCERTNKAIEMTVKSVALKQDRDSHLDPRNQKAKDMPGNEFSNVASKDTTCERTNINAIEMTVKSVALKQDRDLHLDHQNQKAKDTACERTNNAIEMTVKSVALKQDRDSHLDPRNQKAKDMPGNEVSDAQPKMNGMCTTVSFAAAMICFHLSVSAIGIYLPALAIERGFESDVPLIMTMMGIVEIVSMIPLGLVLDAPFAQKYRVYIYCVFLANVSLCSLLLAVVPGVASFSVLAGLSSFTKESVYCQLSAILQDTYGPERMTKVYGLVSGFMGVSLLSWPLILGK